MKRLAAIAVLGVALTACGSSGRVPTRNHGGPVLRVAPSPTALRFSDAENRAFAERDVRKLIQVVVVPAGARRVAQLPPSTPKWFRDEWKGSVPFPASADIRRFWLVHEPLKQVVQFIESHYRPTPRHLAPFVSGRKPKPAWRIGSRPTRGLGFPQVPGRVWQRAVNIAMLPLPGGQTVIAAHAGDEWIRTPPQSAELPDSVKRIDIKSRYDDEPPSVLVHVRNPYDVASIVSWVNGLGVSPSLMCAGGLVGGPAVSLVFRGADGREVGHAEVAALGNCGGLSLTVNGKKAPPLLLSDLFRSIEQRLNIDLTPPKPRDVASCLRGRDWTVSTANTGLTAHKKRISVTLTFHPTGKVTSSRKEPPAVARCLRDSPHFVYYG